MRSWLSLLLLLVLLPLQLSWAAAASYCRHEAQAPGAAHWGHHQHRTHAAQPQDDAPGGQLQVDVDCAPCHAASAVALVAQSAAGAPCGAPSRQPAAAEPARASHVCDPPDRPNWPARS